MFKSGVGGLGFVGRRVFFFLFKKKKKRKTMLSPSWMENNAYTVYHHNSNPITIKNLKNNDQPKTQNSQPKIIQTNIEMKQEICPQPCAEVMPAEVMPPVPLIYCRENG